MKNYYDILEINKNASPEVVEKAYKTLVKKFHPDLQSDESKQNAEEKMKELNEAYETISNPDKREKYNQKLEQIESKKNINYGYNVQTNSQSPMSNQVQTNHTYQQEVKNDKNYNKSNKKDQRKISKQQAYEQKKYAQKIQNAVNKAYYDAYIQDLRNRGYKIVYKKSAKEYLQMIFRAIITLAVTFLVLFLFYQIPFVKNYFSRLYTNNEVFRSFIDIISQVFQNTKNNF